MERGMRHHAAAEPTLPRRGFLARAAGIVGGAAGGAGFALTAGCWPAIGIRQAAGPSCGRRAVCRNRSFSGSASVAASATRPVPTTSCSRWAWNAAWTISGRPQVVADWSGCEPSCSNCGQVCPTGAIRALPLEEKRVARMGLAVVNQQTCLPYAGREACQLCVDECRLAGYDAFEFMRVGTELDAPASPSKAAASSHHGAGRALCRLRTVPDPLLSDQRQVETVADFLRGGCGSRRGQGGSAARRLVPRIAQGGTAGARSGRRPTGQGGSATRLSAGLLEVDRTALTAGRGLPSSSRWVDSVARTRQTDLGSKRISC